MVTPKHIQKIIDRQPILPNVEKEIEQAVEEFDNFTQETTKILDNLSP